MTRWDDQESAGNGAFIAGALAGALLGAGVALLLAPKTGAQMRSGISSGLNTAKDAAARRYRDLAAKAGRRTDDEGYSRSPQPGGDRFDAGSTPSMGESFTANPGTSGYQS